MFLVIIFRRTNPFPQPKYVCVYKDLLLILGGKNSIHPPLQFLFSHKEQLNDSHPKRMMILATNLQRLNPHRSFQEYTEIVDQNLTLSRLL